MFQPKFKNRLNYYEYLPTYLPNKSSVNTRLNPPKYHDLTDSDLISHVLENCVFPIDLIKVPSQPGAQLNRYIHVYCVSSIDIHIIWDIEVQF